MEAQLIDKITQILVAGVETEQAVVYFLVELRKLADKTHYKDVMLRVFCNWVVHTDLSNRAEGSTYILKTIDNEVVRTHEDGTTLGSSPIFHFETFRESLRKLLVHFGLPLDLVDAQAKWRPFIMLYSSVVSECPIVFSASKAPLKYISSIELRKNPRLTFIVNGVIVPRLRWKLIFQDGTRQHISTWGDRVIITWPPKKPATALQPPPHSAPQTPIRPG